LINVRNESFSTDKSTTFCIKILSVHATHVFQQLPNYSMTSKKTPASKSARLPRAADYTKSFIKDWERLSQSGRYDLNWHKKAMLLLIANDGPLGAEWLDQPLKGNWKGHRECHIGGDFL
jgi:mRNA interferase YafQ